MHRESCSDLLSQDAVGDDAALDVLGALGAGMQTVWVNRTEQLWSQDQHPHATVGSMTELCDLLA